MCHLHSGLLESGRDCVRSPCLHQVDSVSALLVVEMALAFSCGLVSLVGLIGWSMLLAQQEEWQGQQCLDLGLLGLHTE